ncbi:MAG TPA: sulfite exporter TauE/SafE family protein [Polyangiaceae bacterium]|nr:sulfite exporter TauE/SafE family protein [Polyangiaceae bacterium]
MIAGWLVPVVTAGALGSLHCVGMCGGLIAVASEGSRGTRQRLSVQLVYQTGRLASYLTLGAAAGGLGRALDLAGRAAGIGKVAAIVAGCTMLLWGLLAMLEAGGIKSRLPQFRLLPRSVLTWLGGLRERPPLLRAALLGSASALLPCGFLYGFALAAAGTGSVARGTAVMAALWLGNLPALLGFGFALSGALSRLRRHLPLLSAATLFGLGVFTLSERTNLPAFALASVVGPSAKPSQPLSLPMAADCPCHRKHHP